MMQEHLEYWLYRLYHPKQSQLQASSAANTFSSEHSLLAKKKGTIFLKPFNDHEIGFQST